MNLYTLIGTLRDAIHDDADLQSWCTTNYGQNQKVYVGVDMRNPPQDDSYPIITLFPGGKNQGLATMAMGHVIRVNCGIVNASNRTIVGKTDVTELAGISDIVSLTADVIDIVVDNVPAGLFPDSSETIYSDIALFPFFESGTDMVINLPARQGMDYFD